MKILILLSLTFFTSISTILAQEITEREFVSIKRLSEDVKKLCPPATCIVIGIGRSPTPVTTYLKAENEHYSWNLPLSNFRFGFYSYLSPAEIVKLHQHFTLYTPSLNNLEGKSILIIDFSIGGKSLVAAKNHLEEYYKEISDNINIPAPKIEAAAFIESVSKNNIKRITGDAIQHFIEFQDNDKLVNNKMNYQSYDYFAQYHSFDIKCDHIEQNLKNANYLDYLKVMKELQQKSSQQEKDQ